MVSLLWTVLDGQRPRHPVRLALVPVVHRTDGQLGLDHGSRSGAARLPGVLDHPLHELVAPLPLQLDQGVAGSAE